MQDNLRLENVSLANLTIGRTPQPDLVRAAAQAGFGKVGLLLMTATAQPLQYEVLHNPQVIRGVKQVLQETGVKVFDIEAFVLSPDTRIDALKPALELGAELGASYISSIGTELHSVSGFLSAAQRIDLFGRLCEAAAQFSLGVGVEFMLYRDISTWREALDLVSSVNMPNAGLIMDVLHFYRGGGKVSDLSDIPVERFAYAQLSDCAALSPTLEELPSEARTSRLHLGDGAIALKELIATLPAGLQMVIETPVAVEQTLPPTVRAQQAARRSEAFFSAL